MNDRELEAAAVRAAQRITSTIIAVGFALGIALVLGFTHSLGPALEAASWLYIGVGAVVAGGVLLTLRLPCNCFAVRHQSMLGRLSCRRCSPRCNCPT